MKKLSALLLILIVTTISCSSEKEKQSEEPRKDKLSPLSTIVVSDEYGQPIAGAKILIGPEEDVPFNDNVLTSKADGTIEIPSAWVSPEDVTLYASGYVTTTYKNQPPGAFNFMIKHEKGEKNIIHNTQLKNYQDVTGDGNIDVGLTFPAFYKSQFIDFDLTDYVSLKMDEIKIVGQSVEIPSNLGMPNQAEWWGFIRVRLNKPNSSMTFSESGLQKLAAVQARFDLSDMIKEVRSNDLEPFSLLELIEFKNGGIKEVNVIENQPTPSNVELDLYTFNQKFSVYAPIYDSKEVLLAMALERTGGQYFPSDIKPLESGQQRELKTRGHNDGLVLTLMRSRDLESGNAEKVARLSGRIYKQNQSNQIELLPIIAPPVLANNGLKLDLPTQYSNEIHPSGIYLSLSQVTSENNQGVIYDLKKVLWEVHLPDWKEDIELPSWNLLPNLQKDQRYLWEVVLLAQSDASQSLDIGPQKLEFTDIFSKNALEFTK